MLLSVKLIINPLAGKIRNNLLSVNKLLKKLNDHQILTEIVYTTADSKDKKMILQNLSQKDAIIVCGGDGTLNRVITYMIQANVYKPILFIPGGTANVFHLEKNLSSKIDTAIDILLNGKKVATDIGFVEHESGINYFLLMLSVGIDSHAITEIDNNVKKLLGKATYLFSGVKNFITYKSKQINIKSDNNKYSNAHTVVISNSRLYGGNIELFPEADMHDGYLDMCVFQAENNVILLKSIVDIRYGKHVEQPFVKFEKINSAEISSSHDSKMPFQVDGEVIGYLPIKVGILKKKIDFFLP